MRKFELGRVVMTRGVADEMEEDDAFQEFCNEALKRYVKGDWGDLSKKDKMANDKAVEIGERLLAAYIYPKTQEKIWIITEWNRSATTLLFPHEY